MLPALPIVILLAVAPPASPPDTHSVPALASPAGFASPKSEGLALALSAFGTAIPVALALGVASTDGSAPFWLFAGGAVVGPSLGHIYAGSTDRVALGVGLRLASGLACLVGLATMLDETAGSNPENGAALFVAGSVVGIGSAVVDVATAPLSARRYNDRNGPQLGVVVARDGSPGVGFSAPF